MIRKLPALKLEHKGILIVALPLILQWFLYLQLKDQITAVEKQAQLQEYSRDVMVQVNSIILQASQLFEAYVNSWAQPNSKLAKRVKPLTLQVRTELDELKILLQTRKEDEKWANAIDTLGDQFLDKISTVSARFNEDASPLALWDALEKHQSFGKTARNLNHALLTLGEEHVSRVRSAQSEETAARERLIRFCDIAVISTIVMSVGLAVFFVKGTVSSLAILKSNSKRLAENLPLLEPIKGQDEIADVDRVFHEMAAALTAAANRERQIMAELDDSYKKLQSVFDTVPVSLVVCTENGEIESINKAGTELFGYETAEIKGKPITAILSREFPRTAGELLKKWSAETRERPIQSEGQSKDQDLLPIEFSTLAFRTSDGARYLMTIIDVAERYKIERMKREFVAMVSHDIRTPLTAINANIELIQTEPESGVNTATATRLKSAQTNVQRLLAMVKNLLDLERLDSGIFQFDYSDFAVSDIVTDCWETIKAQAEQRNIAWNYEPNDLRVHADKESISHVLQNLIGNAVKFCPDNGLIACSVSLENGQVKISVSDNGPGVPDRYKQSVFERFKQAPAGKKGKDGTGLGLAICKSIVDAHGGNVGVADNEGGGSVFWFTLPAEGHVRNQP